MIPIQKQYPSDLTAEALLIGLILCRNELMQRLTFLNADHFYSSAYSDVFGVITKLYGDSQSITPFTVKPLVCEKTIELFDGELVKGLAKLMADSVAMIDPVGTAKQLVDLSRRRQLIEACEATIATLCDTPAPLDECAGSLGNEIERISNENPLSEFLTESQVINSILDDLKNDSKPFSTGLPRLDAAMDGGMYAGKSYGFAAKKKMGKTMLAGTVSMNLNKQGVRHLFICGEMSPQEIEQRILSRELGCFPSAFRSEFGKSPHFMNRIAKLSLDSKNHILFKNAPALTFDDLRRMCRNAVERYQVKGVIIDYWQLIKGKRKGESDAAHLDEVAQWIADFGRKHGVWMFVLAQINQEGNTRGGEGIRLAFDQVYHLRAPEDDPSRSGRFLEMMDTRYTPWANIGSDVSPAYHITEKGLYFEESQA